MPIAALQSDCEENPISHQPLPSASKEVVQARGRGVHEGAHHVSSASAAAPLLTASEVGSQVQGPLAGANLEPAGTDERHQLVGSADSVTCPVQDVTADRVGLNHVPQSTLQPSYLSLHL